MGTWCSKARWEEKECGAVHRCRRRSLFSCCHLACHAGGVCGRHHAKQHLAACTYTCSVCSRGMYVVIKVQGADAPAQMHGLQGGGPFSSLFSTMDCMSQDQVDTARAAQGTSQVSMAQSEPILHFVWGNL